MQAAIAADQPLWDYISRLSFNLVSGQEQEQEQSPYLKAALQRVKEIYPTQKKDISKSGEMGYSLNPTTGVLTAALNLDANCNGPSSSADLGDWLLHSQTQAPKSAIERSNEEAFLHPGSSSGADAAPARSGQGTAAKTWTCTWCHRSVTAASRPLLSGCPRNLAGQHAWHN